MKVKAQSKYVRGSDRKIRYVAELIKGRPAKEAMVAPRYWVAPTAQDANDAFNNFSLEMLISSADLLRISRQTLYCLRRVEVDRRLLRAVVWQIGLRRAVAEAAAGPFVMV